MKFLLKALLKIFVGLIVLMLVYLFVAFILSRMTVQKEQNAQQDMAVYILTNGIHTDLVVPIKSPI
jgi:uncharacterized alpha/beta hydrolase family protein